MPVKLKSHEGNNHASMLYSLTLDRVDACMRYVVSVPQDFVQNFEMSLTLILHADNFLMKLGHNVECDSAPIMTHEKYKSATVEFQFLYLNSIPSQISQGFACYREDICSSTTASLFLPSCTHGVISEKKLMSSLYKSCNNSLWSYFNNNAQMRSQFCTCHDRSCYDTAKSREVSQPWDCML